MTRNQAIFTCAFDAGDMKFGYNFYHLFAMQQLETSIVAQSIVLI